MSRADGTRVKNADPMYTIMPYVLDKRYDSMNMVTLDVPVDPLQEYMKEQRKQGRHISHLTIILAAYIRAACEFPRVNRFVVNKRIYQRNHFCISMVLLKPGEDNATMSKIYFDLDEDIFEVQRKVEEYYEKNQVAEGVNSMDKLMDTLLKVPGLLGFGVGLLKFLDKRGWLPLSIIDASPFHTSLAISNLASIRVNHIYHHVYEFGTTSLFAAMGNLREVPMRIKGEVEIKRCIPLGVVMDERICSGSYFGQFFGKMRSYLANPALLEEKADFTTKD